MKKICVTLVFVLVISLLAFLTAVPIVNDHVARITATELQNIPLPDNTEYIESVYKAAKLVGNGNGMQYFGAILIKSELSIEELKDYYADYAENEWECIVENQTDNNIKGIEHGELSFKAEVEGDNYFIVYSWGDNDTIFYAFDLRGY